MGAPYKIHRLKLSDGKWGDRWFLVDQHGPVAGMLLKVFNSGAEAIARTDAWLRDGKPRGW